MGERDWRGLRGIAYARGLLRARGRNGGGGRKDAPSVQREPRTSVGRARVRACDLHRFASVGVISARRRVVVIDDDDVVPRLISRRRAVHFDSRRHGDVGISVT